MHWARTQTFREVCVWRRGSADHKWHLTFSLFENKSSIINSSRLSPASASSSKSLMLLLLLLLLMVICHKITTVDRNPSPSCGKHRCKNLQEKNTTSQNVTLRVIRTIWTGLFLPAAQPDVCSYRCLRLSSWHVCICSFDHICLC